MSTAVRAKYEFIPKFDRASLSRNPDGMRVSVDIVLVVAAVPLIGAPWLWIAVGRYRGSTEILPALRSAL